MSAAYEMSADDPEGLAEAVRRAAEGSTVHLIRGGKTLADIVPAPGVHDDAERQARGRAIEARQAARFGAPSVEDIRALYVSQGWVWPGDDEVRRQYVVADAS